jgi:integrase
VFHRDGRPIRSLRRAWRTASRDAGLPGLLPHDLRRSAVRNPERPTLGGSRRCLRLSAAHRKATRTQNSFGLRCGDDPCGFAAAS